MPRIDNLVNDAKRYESVRQIRWPDGVRCVWRQSDQVRRRGLHQRQRERQRYYCKACDSDFDDGHKTVCHNEHEFASDEDGDSFCEVHVSTIEGFWSLLRSRLLPHRGISQESLSVYLGFFEFAHNVRKRGRALLGSLSHVAAELTPRFSY
jgi:hypothetical protein